MNLTERYASAVHAHELKFGRELDRTAETQSVDTTDVLAAYAYAGRALETGWRPTGPGGQGERVPTGPSSALAVPLSRLFAGDDRAVHAIVVHLAGLAWKHARSIRGAKCSPSESLEIARACLAWHRDGVCKHCGGHGYQLLVGTGVNGVGGVHGDTECPHCEHGKRPFEREFAEHHRELARWLVAQVLEPAIAQAGPQAMRSLRDAMDW